MGVNEVAKAIGKPLVLTDDYSDDPKVCAQMPLPGQPSVFVLFEDQKLTSIWLSDGARFKSSKGIGVGDTEEHVKTAYPNIEVTDADYDEAPAANLTYWVKKDVAGLEFRTDTSKRVISIAAGGRSIGYAEGCL